MVVEQNRVLRKSYGGISISTETGVLPHEALISGGAFNRINDIREA